MAQTLEHEMLKIEHTVAVLASGGAQQPQGIWMPIEKIGVLAQVGNDVARADLARPRRRGTATADRLWLVLRTVGQCQFRGIAPRRGPEEDTTAKRCAVIL
jgi:hypothetical protein